MISAPVKTAGIRGHYFCEEEKIKLHLRNKDKYNIKHRKISEKIMINAKQKIVINIKQKSVGCFKVCKFQSAG